MLDRAVRLSVVVVVGALLPACAASGEGADEGLRGARIELLAVWSGAEQQRFERVLQGFEHRTGVGVTYTSAGHGVPSALAARLADGKPPDIAVVPQPGLLRGYARRGVLVPLDRTVDAAVTRNYSAVWRQLGSLDGVLYGVPFKAADKSLVWYNVAAFEHAGVVPPDDLAGLDAVERALLADGVPAYSMGGGDGWTLTDWFENLYLREAGPDRYDLLAEHRIPWTDGSVKATLGLLLAILRPEVLAGGVVASVTTRFEASVENAFPATAFRARSSAPPPAAMVFEGDFVAGVITAKTDAVLGVDVDVFPFPAVTSPSRAIVGGGDLAVLMRRSRAGEALMRYLASPEAASLWATQGGFISPNLNVDLSIYPDAITRGIARAVLDAGNDFRFDLSDLAPAAFGGTEGQGMRKRLQDLLVSRDVDATAALLEADATAAYAP